MSEKDQFNTRIREDLIHQIKSVDKSNTDIATEAFEMWFQAHGMDSPESIRREVETIDKEIESIRARANQEISEKQERRDRLTQALETMLAEQESAEKIIRAIATELDEKPNRTIEGFSSEVSTLLQKPDFEVRHDIIQAIEDYADENTLLIRREQLYPRQDTGAIAATDGSGEEESEIDPSRYEFGDSE